MGRATGFDDSGDGANYDYAGMGGAVRFPDALSQCPSTVRTRNERHKWGCDVNILTIEIILGVIVVLALFGFFLRRVSQEQGSVDNLSHEIDSMELEQRQKEAAALKELKRAVDPNSKLKEDDR